MTEKIIYEQGQCPFCNCTHVRPNSAMPYPIEDGTNMIYLPFVCTECGKDFEEEYNYLQSVGMED